MKVNLKKIGLLSYILLSGTIDLYLICSSGIPTFKKFCVVLQKVTLHLSKCTLYLFLQFDNFSSLRGCKQRPQKQCLMTIIMYLGSYSTFIVIRLPLLLIKKDLREYHTPLMYGKSILVILNRFRLGIIYFGLWSI